ncbi:MAG TPA: glycosyl hydrolase 115 family protein [Cellvibrio sp.]
MEALRWHGASNSRAVHGPYDYWNNRERIYNFWESRVKESASYENIYTIGMRGRRDEGMMAPEGTTNEEKAAKIQHDIIPDQRQMIADHLHENPAGIPQIFIPYKETLVQYQSGLTLPDDVTIVWPDDNHGYIRQLSTPAENARSGGSGVYYHLQYWGVPRSYLWFHTTPLGMTQSEMIKAWDFNANKIWIVNVGDIKPYEMGTDFFMRLARNPEAFRNFDQRMYLTQWAAYTFGSAHADAIADVLENYLSLNIKKRPEQLDLIDSGFSPAAKGDEAQHHLPRRHSLPKQHYLKKCVFTTKKMLMENGII